AGAGARRGREGWPSQMRRPRATREPFKLRAGARNPCSRRSKFATLANYLGRCKALADANLRHPQGSGWPGCQAGKCPEKDVATIYTVGGSQNQAWPRGPRRAHGAIARGMIRRPRSAAASIASQKQRRAHGETVGVRFSSTRRIRLTREKSHKTERASLMDLVKAAGIGTEITLGGRKYTVKPNKIKDVAEFTGWLHAKLDNPVAKVLEALRSPACQEKDSWAEEALRIWGKAQQAARAQIDADPSVPVTERAARALALAQAEHEDLDIEAELA